MKFGHTLVDYIDTEAGVVAQIQGPDGLIEIKSKWLIGTDGASSVVREKMDVTFDGMTWPFRFVAANVHAKFEQHGYSAVNFIARPKHNGVVVVIDSKIDLWRIAYSESADLDPETVADRFEEYCAKPFIPEGVEYEIAALRQYRLHQRAASTFRKGHVLLAGDAAHITSPIGGLGLSGGIWDAMIVSDLIAAVERGEEHESILDQYSQERRRVFWEVVTPGAKENLRVIGETDLKKQRLDFASAKAASEDPEIGRLVLLFSHKLIGDPIRRNFRWKDAHKTQGVDMDKICAQMGNIAEPFDSVV